MFDSITAKILNLATLERRASEWRRNGRTVAYCHGCFDLVHPGHLRYLQFARQHGDVLVVSLTGDDAIEKSDGMRPHVPQEHRAESLAAIAFVDAVVIADHPTAEPVIRALQPEVYVKGKEYERSSHADFLAERKLVEQLGGRMIFSSGEIVYSSTELLDHASPSTLDRDGELRHGQLEAYCQRWNLTADRLAHLLTSELRGQRVLVVGDLLLDSYVFCHPADATREAPMLTVQPRRQDDFIGGAGIVAAHVAGLGGRPHLITVGHDNDAYAGLVDRLTELGVEVTSLAPRRTLATKIRFLVDDQKVFRVQNGEPEPLDSASELRLLALAADLKNDLDAVIMTDFGFGTVTSSLLARLLPLLRPHVHTISGDVSGPRRTLLAYEHMDLLTPNEWELRSVAGDFEQSLPTVAAELMKRIRLPNLALTLGQKGCLLMRPREEDPEHWFESRLRCDYLPGLARRAVDALGAGDALLAASTMGLAAGLPLPAAGYLGSLGAMAAVSRVGNQPLRVADLLTRLHARPELRRHQPDTTTPDAVRLTSHA